MDRYTEAECTITTLMVSLTRQVQEVTVRVRNLTTTVANPKPAGAPTGTTTRQRSQPAAKSYAKAAAQAAQNATSATPAKGKRKAEVGPILPKQQTIRIAKRAYEQ